MVRDRDKLTSVNDRLMIARAKDIETLRDSGFSLLESDGRYAILKRK